MLKYKVFVVDDEIPNLESLERILKTDGAEVKTFSEPQTAISAFYKETPDLIVTDLRMGQWNGLELLEAAKFFDPAIEVILVTAYGTVEVAVEAIKKGAYDFVTKPLQRLQVLKSVHKALEKRRLVQENNSLRQALSTSTSFQKEVIGNSPLFLRVKEIALQAAASKASVFIDGESGTGKGLIADFIHYHSHSEGALVNINCTAIPENLLEAELFGYEAGAFTGANKKKRGKIELAKGGTLFLDEIGIAPISLQTKLLRFLQGGEFERLGSNEVLRVDTRIISATNVDLQEAIRSGKLREDLFYRLNVIHIRVPPLRERVEDIRLLGKVFLGISSKRNGRPIPFISEEVLKYLENYSWPGNIRELQNLMERLVVLNKTGFISLAELPQEITNAKRPNFVSVPIGMPLKQVEGLLIDQTLKSTGGEKRLAARLLGLHPRTIYRYLENAQPSSSTTVDAAVIAENHIAKDFASVLV